MQESDTTKADGVLLMKTSQIREELKKMNVDYSDCFDKESLIKRLQDVKNGNSQTTKEVTNSEPAESKKATTQIPENVLQTTQQQEQQQQKQIIEFDEVAMLQEIRQMKVRELREELAARQIRWGGLLEKEDLVRALYESRKRAMHFSITGLIQPGQVTDLTSEQLETEMRRNNSSNKDSTLINTPLLVDVYATWCGPCKIMAEQLKQAANDSTIRDRVRIAKLDSDKYPQLAGSLRVGGLPTLILFDCNGTEIDRVEGAMMKNQLIDWVVSKI